MIEYRLENFNRIKDIFIDCMRAHSAVLKWAKEECMQKIASDIAYPKDILYREQIEKYILAKCDKLSQTNNDIASDTFVVDGTRWIIFQKHFYMLAKLENRVPIYYSDIFMTLNWYRVINKKINRKR